MAQFGSVGLVLLQHGQGCAGVWDPGAFLFGEGGGDPALEPSCGPVLEVCMAGNQRKVAI